MSKIYDQCPTQATAHHATRVLVTVEIWVMNVLTMPLHLGHSDLPSGQKDS